MPHTSLLETATILKEKRATLEISQEQDSALADVIFVSMGLANRVAVQRYSEELALDKPVGQHATHVLPNFATRMILGLLRLLDPAHAVWPALLRCEMSAYV